MTVDLDKLEQLARAAAEESKSAEWTRERDWVEATDSHAFVRPYAAAGRYILAANPAAVLELVERLRKVAGAAIEWERRAEYAGEQYRRRNKEAQAAERAQAWSVGFRCPECLGFASTSITAIEHSAGCRAVEATKP